MKRLFDWQVILGLVLMTLSVLVYFIHFLIFRDAHHIFIYLIGDIAFVFFEVLMVTLILHRLLTFREKRQMLNKLNMVIGAFFSEVGVEFIRMLISCDARAGSLAPKLVITSTWTDKDFIGLETAMKRHSCAIDQKKWDLEGMKVFLLGKRGFLLTLLENPNLLEHESFTNLLWAVFHVTEELSYRKDVRHLSPSDSDHVAGDIKRAYHLIIAEWIEYTRHLKSNYPYLFSLAVRTNPFDPNATVEVS